MVKMPTVRMKTFDQVLSDALDEMLEEGFKSQEQVDYWLKKLEEAAHRSLTPPAALEKALRNYQMAVYRKQVDKAKVLEQHKGISDYDILGRLKPELKAELSKRVNASANLIKLNRDQEIEAMKRRFSGLVTSIPEGGSKATDRGKAKENIRKSISGLSFRERRVLIDQGHKLESTISEIVAQAGGAIAGIWHSHWRQANYDYREDHKERDERIYVVPDNWAIQKGLMKKGSNTYPLITSITRPGEDVNCRCFYQWLYSPAELPRDLLTQKGIEELERVEREIRNYNRRSK
jgi:hypothetical protein